MRKTCFMTVAAVMFLTFFAGFSSAEEFRLLTWKGYAPEALVKKFEKETGYTVKVTYSNNEEMIAKLRATRGAGFDLAQPSQDRIASVQAKYRIYQAMDYTKLKTEQFIPSMLAAVKKNTLVKGNSHAVPFCWGTSGLVVNKKMAPDVKNFADLFNPKYAGRISYRVKRPTLIATAFAMGENPFAKYNDPKAYKTLMESVGKKLMDGKSLVKNYWANGDALLDSMRSGEVWVAMAWDNGGFKLHSENADIDFVAPSEGALGWIDTYAIPAKAKNVKAAYAWINFMMHPENAAYFTNHEKYPTAAMAVAPLLDKAIAGNMARCFPQAAVDNIKWYPPVPAKLEAFEGKTLDKVKAAK
ncbi:MAG: extracellular solute-binding protein [Desulfobacterales bacterium]|nr:extracellular solute-binding protein [Desulfobacterales bacterium]